MSILFAGSLPYEFVNVPALVSAGDVYDPTHVEGAISKTAYTNQALAHFFKIPTAQEVWVHTKVLLGASIQTGVTGGSVLTLLDQNNAFIAGITAGNGPLYLTSGNAEVNITGVVARNVLCDMDLHLYQSGSLRIIELYVDGNLVATTRATATWAIPRAVLMSGLGASANYFSELIVMEGNAPTIGMRLHSKRPDPSLPGLNTFDAGFWGSLGNGNLIDGVVTTEVGARITGGFQPYTGPATPLGIRGILQSGRYLKNGTLLKLGGQLRIADVNYDTPDIELDDGARILSFWEDNPATGAAFTVADFSGLQGGYYTKL